MVGVIQGLASRRPRLPTRWQLLPCIPLCCRSRPGERQQPWQALLVAPIAA
jgi:hypothetical protein